jgi:3-oxoacyl-[acyl-carrier protein] reductase
MAMKNIIVTGSSRGIGKCLVENLAKEGNNVLLNYNKSEKQALQIQRELKEDGFLIEIFKADVSKKSEVKKMIDYALNKWGYIDVLINNAGIAKLNLFQNVTEEEWDEIINTNLKSAFCATQLVLPSMINRKNGLIINISSMWGLVGASCETIYSISKAGIDAMTKSLAKELGPSNIRVNSIAPGIIDTDMNSILDEHIKNELKDETPLGKIGKPIDIYRCVKWLMEDEFTTGQVISVNGGYVIT